MSIPSRLRFDDGEKLKDSEEVLDPRNHSPSPLSIMNRYRNLCEIVLSLRKDLPPGMTLLNVIEGVREKTWVGLKGVMSKYVTSPFSKSGLMGRNLITAAEAMKWPTKITYPSVPANQRRAFERAYQDLLYLQAEYVLLFFALCLLKSDEGASLTEQGRKTPSQI
jgi:hypothetical protein